MSPIGGFGINLAGQEAVAAANVLAGPLAQGADPDPLLHRVQARRWRATRWMQALQAAAQRRLILPLLERRVATTRIPPDIPLLNRFPPLRRLPPPVIRRGFGHPLVYSPLHTGFSSP